MKKVADAFGFELRWSEIHKEIGSKSIKKIGPLFPKLGDLKELKEMVTNPTPLENYFETSIDDFKKLDLRVAEVIEAERVEGTRLLKLVVDVGELGKRQIIAGIGDKYGPDDMKGKKIIIIANLKPKKIRGLISQGMMLATEEKIPLTPSEEAKNGSKIF